jgi:ABC-type Mn2+/Zn2+ transport system ATPase subunit
MGQNLAYYTAHSPITDPGPYAYLYDDLPDDLEQLFRIINGVLFHKSDAEDRYGPTSVQRKEQFLRTMEQRLARIVELDPSSLTIPREMKERQIAYCRDYAVLMTSILRHKGHPARTRAGFGQYFLTDPPYKGDHWVTEYWDSEEARWRLVDANIGGGDLEYLEEQVRAGFKPGLDFTDLRRNGDFHLAPHAWLLCRSGEANIALFRHNAHWRGWPMLRGNLLHDFQALNRLEMGLFDYWDDLHAKPESEMTAQDRALLDRIARVAHDPDGAFDEMRALFEELPRTRVIRSRLHLIGVLGDGVAKTADGLHESDMARLIAMTGGPARDDRSREAEHVPDSSTETKSRTSIRWRDWDGIVVLGARQNNLKNIDVHIPRNKLVVITGVSGSGKSSLAFDTIYAEGQRRYVESLSSFARRFMKQMEKPQVDKMVGLNPRSNPGTYVGVLGEVRQVFAATGQARAMGYREGHFSFNTKEGRCEACEGYGAKKVKLHFMADVWVRCQECEGKRYTPQILAVLYHGKNIADVLEMDVQEALAFFADHPRIRSMLQTLLDVGLGYIKLGQSALTLSGGEAQRVKLAKELSRTATGSTLYILDEPTTGLHFADIQNLLDILHRLVDAGNTVMVIEHNLDVVKTADWIVDLGPEGGDDGGTIVAEGPPEEVAGVEASYTGRFLREVLAN